MPTTQTRQLQLFILILSILGGVILLISMRSGPGVNTDTVEYMFAAKSLLHGDGLRGTSFGLNGFGNGPFTLFPPLNPLILAVFGLVGFNLLTAATIINAVSFAIVLYASGYLLTTYIKSRTLVVLAMLTIFTSIPLWRAYIMALSEPIFILLLILCCVALIQFMKEPKALPLILAALLAGLSTLQRYAGVAAILTGFIVLLAPTLKFSLLKRLRYLITFGVVSCTPLVAWLFGTYLMTSHLGGTRQGATATLAASLSSTLEWITTWFMPSVLPLLLRDVIFIGVFLAMAVALVYYWRKDRQNGTVEAFPWGALFSPPFVFLVAYLGFLILASIVTEIDPIWNRFLAPAFIFVIWLMFVVIDEIAKRITLPFTGRTRQLVIVGLSALWIAYPASRFVIEIWSYFHNDLGIYNPFDTPEYRESELTQWVKANGASGQIYSNAPDVLFVLTDSNAQYPATREMDATQFRQSMPAGDSYLVWYTGLREDVVLTYPGSPSISLILPKDLVAAGQIELVKETPDGAIYRYK